MDDLKTRQQRWKKIRSILVKHFPNRKSELNYSTDWELLVAVILSAQCTDDQVNKVTEKLFKKYPTFKHYVDANPREFEKDIFSTGFYRNKTRHILRSAHKINNEFNGTVPNTMEGLTSLPGVARKTANVVLQNCFDVLEGIAVDTHLLRFAWRFGLSDSRNNADTTERYLMEVIDRSEWMVAGYWIKEYGRRYGRAPGSGYRKSDDILIDFVQKSQ